MAHGHSRATASPALPRRGSYYRPPGRKRSTEHWHCLDRVKSLGSSFQKLATCVCLLPLLPLTALGTQQGDFEFEHIEDVPGVVITGYSGPGGAVVIPES